MENWNKKFYFLYGFLYLIIKKTYKNKENVDSNEASLTHAGGQDDGSLYRPPPVKAHIRGHIEAHIRSHIETHIQNHIQICSKSYDILSKEHYIPIKICKNPYRNI